MQKLTIICLFAETSQPVFAYNILISAIMSIRTEAFQLALAFLKEIARRRIGFVHLGEG